MSGHVKILALLLDRGSDPDLGNSDGTTPAHYACQFGHLKVLELLVKRGADVNKRDADGDTPLDYARAFEQRECVDLLILNGARGIDMEDLPTVSKAQKVCAAASFSTLSVCPSDPSFSHDVPFSIPPSGPNSRHNQSSERSAEGRKTVRVPIVPGQGEGRGGPAQVRWVQSGVILQQGARCAT
jgi:ankyrin repeat protein